LFDITSAITNELQNVATAMDKANFRNLGHAAASLRKRARESMQQSPNASPPGSPPNTRRKQLPNAIVFAADEHSALIGPRWSRVGEAAAVHEFGGTREAKKFVMTQHYPPRPYMGPALEESVSRFHAEWHNSLGG
jgi:phage gpG-like protein